jgi:hypothetical protein
MQAASGLGESGSLRACPGEEATRLIAHMSEKARVKSGIQLIRCQRGYFACPRNRFLTLFNFQNRDWFQT